MVIKQQRHLHLCAKESGNAKTQLLVIPLPKKGNSSRTTERAATQIRDVESNLELHQHHRGTATETLSVSALSQLHQLCIVS